MKKKVWVTSLVSIMLCLSLIAGSTFALFTSVDSVNIAVTAAKVEMLATIDEASLDLYSPRLIDMEGNIIDAENAAQDEHTFANGGTATLDRGTLTLSNITPGDEVTFMLSIENRSNVSIIYSTSISCDEKGRELLRKLDISIGGETVVGKSAWTALEANASVDELECRVTMPATADNDCQGKSCTLTFTVEAAQGNTEPPVLLNDQTTADPEWYDAEASELLIEDAADFLAFMETAYTWGVADRVHVPDFAGQTVKLTVDIEFSDGYHWTPISPYDSTWNSNGGFKGTFDGQGHCIKNLNVTNENRTGRGYRMGLFGEVGDGAVFKNLILDGVNTYAGNSSAGALCALTNGNVTFENITVRNATVRQGRFAGGIVGDIRGSGETTVTFRNCTVENSAIFNIHNNYCGALYGAKDSEVHIVNENCTVSNVVKHFFKDASGTQDWETYHYISLADALTAYASEPAGFGGN